jgi:crotonobetainyl-CoA:carnitine CoA-transferase CaiB-like acyl-CoA transferase
VCSIGEFEGLEELSRKSTASELTLQAGSWPWRFIGHPEEPPLRNGTDVIGTWTAIFAVQAVLLGLMEYARLARPSRVHLSRFGAAITAYSHYWYWETGFTNDHWLAHSDALPDEFSRSYPVYRTADGATLVDLYGVGIIPSNEKWERLIARLGIGHLLADPRFATFATRRAHIDEWLAASAAAFASMTSAKLVTIVGECGGVASPLNDLATAAQDPQFVEMLYITRTEWPDQRLAIAPPWQFSATPATVRMPAPREINGG